MEINEFNDLKKIVRPILNKYGITKVEITGSFARGDFTGSSDIDLLVEAPKSMSLLTFAGIKIELEEKLGRKVDLLERSAIKPGLRPHLLKDAKPI